MAEMYKRVICAKPSALAELSQRHWPRWLLSWSVVAAPSTWSAHNRGYRHLSDPDTQHDTDKTLKVDQSLGRTHWVDMLHCSIGRSRILVIYAIYDFIEFNHVSSYPSVWTWVLAISVSGVPDLWDRTKILRCDDLSHLHVPDVIWVFFYFVCWFIHHNIHVLIVTFWIFTYYI